MIRAPGALFLSLLLVMGLGAPSAPAAELLVGSFNTNSILRYDAATGAFGGVFNQYNTTQPQGLFVHGDRVYVTAGPIVVFDAWSGAKMLEFRADATCFPVDVTVGPDGDIYTACYDNIGGVADRVIRNDPRDGHWLGEYVAPGTAPISYINGLAFGPDGKLYVGSSHTDTVVRFDGPNDPSPTIFDVGSIGLDGPSFLTFGPDGKLYVSGRFSNSVARLDPTSGSMSVFVPRGSGGLWLAGQLAFGPDGNLYVASVNTDQVLRYDGSTGAFIDAFVPAGLGSLDAPMGIAFDPPGTVACAPRPNCRGAGKSLLLIKDGSDDAKDRLTWKWLKGEATTVADFGVPTDTTAYTLCLYAGTASALLGSADVPSEAHWSAISDKGYRFKDPNGRPDGIQKAILKSGAAGRTKVLVKGKGSGLPDLSLPVGDPVTVQLVNGANGICWGATYSGAELQRNENGRLKAKTP